ncbi:MAG: hypothetical protein U9R27_09805 [Campylobacterota bacterium]|nr:hypothetical protein [Campylobacterota bacterium]
MKKQKQEKVNKVESKYIDSDSMDLEQEKSIIKPFFDESWYKKTFNVYDMCPIEHFCKYGVYEFKNPNQVFDIKWYLNEYEDVRNAGGNAFYHYILFGKSEKRFQNKNEKNLSTLKLNTKPYFNKKEYDYMSLYSFNTDKKNTLFLDYIKGDRRGDLKSLSIGEDIKLLSLDIWDTVLRRKCHPDEIKLSSARYLYLNYFKYLKPAYRDMITLYKSRKKSENLVRLTDDFEFRYADAVEIWLPMIFETGTTTEKFQELKDRLLKHEFDAESRSTQRDSAMDRFLSNANFPQTIFASDFYMPRSFIEKLLIKNSLDHHFTSGYASCDSVKNKRSGMLFDHLIEEFDIKPDEILHIGDNKNSDVETPSRKNIFSYHYHNREEEKLTKWFKGGLDDSLNGSSSVHSERVLSILEDLANQQSSQLEALGVRFAPVAVGYILHIIEDAKKLGVDKIFFFTREGIFLKEIYDLIVQLDPYHTDYPKSILLDVSRIATFAPSLEKIDTTNLMRMWNQYSTQTPRAFCKTINIDSDRSKSLFEEYKFDYDKEIVHPWEKRDFISLLESDEFKKIIDSRVAVQKKLLLKYLSDKGLRDSQSLSIVVDLGWRGTIQDNISHLIDERIHGCYLGLFTYLNQQRDEVSKSGWLFDKNIVDEDCSIEEIGPIEMLFNGLGGSVIGYREVSGTVTPITKEEESEDQVYRDYTVHFQNGIKTALEGLIEYISIHAMTSNDLKAISKSLLAGLINNPPHEIAEAFFKLTHNETFGAGLYQKMDSKDQFLSQIKDKKGSDLHFEISSFLKNNRWPDGIINLKEIQNLKSLKSQNFTHSPIEFYKKLFLNNQKTDYRVALYAPSPLVGSGGHKTLYNLASKFVQAGCEVYCFIETLGEGIDAVYHYLGENRAFVYVGWPDDLKFDLAIATIAHSAKFVSDLKNVKYKAYLVQDFEAWFNPVGDTYTMAENSYSHGLLHFTVGNFLTHMLTNQYGAKAIPSGLGIDTNIYFDKGEEREDAISFLYQPEKDRRNPKLAIEALRIVKEKNPDIKIYIYGSDLPLTLDFEVVNLGFINDLTELNNLYNKCQIGLCISMSNPSRIPFEFMAAGVVPVDLYRYNNLLDYPSNTLKLAYQSSQSIADAIIELTENREELEERQRLGKSFAHTKTLEWEMDVFVNSALSLLNGQKLDTTEVKSNYHEEPYIAKQDMSREVIAFCNWQKRLATNNIVMDN